MDPSGLRGQRRRRNLFRLRHIHDAIYGVQRRSRHGGVHDAEDAFVHLDGVFAKISVLRGLECWATFVGECCAGGDVLLVGWVMIELFGDKKYCISRLDEWQRHCHFVPGAIYKAYQVPR